MGYMHVSCRTGLGTKLRVQRTACRNARADRDWIGVR